MFQRKDVGRLDAIRVGRAEAKDLNACGEPAYDDAIRVGRAEAKALDNTIHCAAVDAIRVGRAEAKGGKLTTKNVEAEMQSA